MNELYVKKRVKHGKDYILKEVLLDIYEIKDSDGVSLGKRLEQYEKEITELKESNKLLLELEKKVNALMETESIL